MVKPTEGRPKAADIHSAEDVERFFALFLEFCDFAEHWRARDPLFEHMDSPSAPGGMAASLVLQALRAGAVPFEAAGLAGPAALDLALIEGREIVIPGDGDKAARRIAVKATTRADQTTLGPRDYAADVFVWVRLADFLSGAGREPAEILFCPRPGHNLSRPLSRASKERLYEQWGDDDPIVAFKLNPTRLSVGEGPRA